jgi:hypothetical protein
VIPVLLGWGVVAVLAAWGARRGGPVLRALFAGLVAFGYTGILLSVLLLLASFVFFVAGLMMLVPLALLTLLLAADGLATAWGSRLGVWLTRLPAALVGPMLWGLVIWGIHNKGDLPSGSIDTTIAVLLLPWLLVSLGLVGLLTLPGEAGDPEAADAPRSTE